MAKLVEEFEAAINDRNAERVGKIVDVLRFKHKMNYKQTYDLAHQLTSIDEAMWENLLYEADWLESDS